jgi:hypothetical protein
MCRPLPAHPRVSPFSQTWVETQGQPDQPLIFAPLGIVPNAGPDERHDNSLPLYHDAGAASVAHVVRCGGVPWSDFVCRQNHMTDIVVRIPSGAFPAGNSDRHLSVEDDAAGRELDFIGVTDPDNTPRSPLHVNAAGQCPYDGDGTHCSGSTATGIATSLGAIDPAQVLAEEADPHGSLPYALATSLLCASPEWVYPADHSDGDNTDATAACAGHLGRNRRPPEGVRYFLDLSDDEIDATANKPYDKVILRTLDREHFGGTVTDTNWPYARGPALQFLRDGWAPIFSEAGLWPGAHDLPLTTDGIDLPKSLKFCTNGTC